jgi:hypothetical protein
LLVSRLNRAANSSNTGGLHNPHVAKLTSFATSRESLVIGGFFVAYLMLQKDYNEPHDFEPFSRARSRSPSCRAKACRRRAAYRPAAVVLGGPEPQQARPKHPPCGHPPPPTARVGAYARDVGYADEAELWHIAVNDRAEFERRHLDTLQTRDAHIIGVERTHYLPGIRRAVVVTFIEEELVHQLVDVMFPWWDTRPGLSPARPLRPANAKPVDVDDDMLSSIGRDLLTLAARPRSGGGAGNLSATLAERRVRAVS